MAKEKTTKKANSKKTEKIEKVSKRINFETGIYENLQLVAGAKGISVSDYVNDILRKKFKKIDDNTPVSDLRKL